MSISSPSGPLVARNASYMMRAASTSSEANGASEPSSRSILIGDFETGDSAGRAPVEDAVPILQCSSVSNAARVARELEPGVGIFDDRPGEIGASKE